MKGFNVGRGACRFGRLTLTTFSASLKHLPLVERVVRRGSLGLVGGIHVVVRVQTESGMKEDIFMPSWPGFLPAYIFFPVVLHKYSMSSQEMQ